RLRSPGTLQPEQDRETVLRGQDVEHRRGARALGERGGEFVRHRAVLAACVRLVPPAVSLGTIDFGLAPGAHPTLLDQARDVVAIAYRPDAARPPRGEPTQ